MVASSLLYRKRPEPLPTNVAKPVLPKIEPVITVARPPAPTVKPPLPEICTSPPVDVPAAVGLPALSKMAELVALVVLIACDSNKLASVTKFTVPLVKPMV